MIQSAILYQAGSNESLNYQLSLNLIKSGFSESRSVLIVRFIEFWCQKNCSDIWSVHETSKILTVSFEQIRDAVLFKMSEEYDYLDGKSKLVIL
jgi:hypothetical protein